MKVRGRRVGVGLGALAVVIVAALAYGLRTRIAEEWHLYRLRTGDAQAKQHAAQRLEALSSTRMPYLIFRLRSGDDRYFRPCAEGLARAGAVAVAPLVELIRDVSAPHEVRRHAAEALGKIGKAAWSGAPALLECLRELEYDPGLSYHEYWKELQSAPRGAASAPGNAGIRDSYWASSSSVILALGGMDSQDSEILAILTASLANDWMRRPAAEALARLAPDDTRSVLALGAALEVPDLDNSSEAEFRTIVVEALVEFGPKAVPAIPALREALLDRWRKVRSGAARALGAMGPRAEEATGDLTALLDDRDEIVREAATEALQRIRAR